MSMSLTPQQIRIFRLIRESRNTRGYSPTMQEIANALGISKVTVFEHVEALVEKGALVRQPNKARSLAIADEAALPDESTKSGELPLVGRIAAGHPVEKYEQHVDGMSMRDEGILDGDYVIVEQRSVARNGERVVALLPNGETTLKTFFKEKGHIRLQPANPEFEPIIVPECAIQGVVVGVLRRYERN